MSIFDSITPEEVDFVERIMRELGAVHWARPLLSDIKARGRITSEDMSKYFELRFAFALYEANISAAYEVSGEGNSKIDFEFLTSGQCWRVELMRLGETNAARRATRVAVGEVGIPLSIQVLSSDAIDRTQSDEGEILKAIQRICQKLERNGKPHKFPRPEGAYHVILIDTRSFLQGGDHWDYVQVALGSEYVPHEHRFYWDGELISGVFHLRNCFRGAVQARDRVHFLGFVNEITYGPGEFAKATKFIWNPNIFVSADEAQKALSTWPLRPSQSSGSG